MHRWEYVQDLCPLGGEPALLDARGQEGWELCGLVAGQARLGSPLDPTARLQPSLVLVFKRPAPLDLVDPEDDLLPCPGAQPGGPVH